MTNTVTATTILALEKRAHILVDDFNSYAVALIGESKDSEYYIEKLKRQYRRYTAKLNELYDTSELICEYDIIARNRVTSNIYECIIEVRQLYHDYKIMFS